MQVYYDKQARQYCACENIGTISMAAWGNSKQEAIERLNQIKKKRE